MCVQMCVSRCVYVCACRYVSMHSSVLVLLHACELFRNRYTLTKHPIPSPLPSTQPSARSPTQGQAGARHYLRLDEHPRTTKAVVVEVTACDRMSSQRRPRQHRQRPRSRTAMRMYPPAIVTRHPSAIREVDMTPGNLRQDPDLV